MIEKRRTFRWQIVGFAVLFLVGSVVHPTAHAEQTAPPILFDMGTKDSPLELGYIRVTAEESYSAEKGYGFKSAGHAGFRLQAPEKWNVHQLPLDEHFEEHGSPLIVDGVRDTNDIVFRVDVPPGTYRVTVSLGDLLDPMGSVSLVANGETIENNIAFHHGLYRYLSDRKREKKGSLGVTGFYDRIRFTVEALEGYIEILTKGDQSQYDRLYEIEDKRGHPLGRLSFQTAWHDTVPPFQDIGEPFVDVPLLGVEIRPYQAPPVTQPEFGILAYSGESMRVKDAIDAFNRRQFDAAEKALGRGGAEEDRLAAGLVYMYLAGWPNHDGEKRLAEAAHQALSTVLDKDPLSVVAIESLETLAPFIKGLDRHINRAGPGEHNHFIENMRACHLFQLAQPSDPLFWKSRLTAARAAYMLDPMHREVSAGTGYRWMKEIYAKFPDNPWARYYVTGEFDSESGVWQVPDYAKNAEGAPAWAASLYEIYNTNLDLAQWWFTHKQRPDGSIGGGWGDDVESAGWLSMFAILSEGSSPTNIQGLANMCQGVFASGDIDEETGFIYMQTDFEHATEWTGDTLPLMMAAEFGNPLWIERAFGSARLMRDLWTGVNKRGHRHFRNMYIGGMSIGTDPQHAHDKAMAWRGVYPIERIYWYSQHPAVAKLLLEWSDAWHQDAMSELLGKPKGYIPSIISYEDCRLGGPVEKSGKSGWRFQFGGTKGYCLNIIVMGYLITGDEKYLEPLRIESAAYAQMQDIEEDKKRRKAFTPGFIKWVLGQSKETLDKIEPPEKGDLRPYYTYDEVTEELKGDKEELRARWPMWTTEASATDRVGTGELMDVPLRIMGGGGIGKSDAVYSHSVTFQGIERDFASIVTGNYLHRLSLAIYLFRDGSVDMAIRPWDLQVGCTYKATVSLDANEDGKPDGPSVSLTYKLTSRGQPCPIRIQGRKTHLISLELVGEPGEPTPTPDLSLWAGDIELTEQWHGKYITVRVHNTGTADAKEVPVVLYEGTPEDGVKLDERLIGHLEWPRDLRPATIKLGWRYKPKGPEAVFTAVIDPENILNEIVENNNRATRVIRFDGGSGKK